MRVGADTNILISALLTPVSLSVYMIDLWRDRQFDLVMSADQLGELMRVIPTRVDIDASNKKAEKSSFLKKRTKKLLSRADITIGAGW